jgi:hypothetical protein
MKEIVNRLCFTANLRERDLECLISSLNRLRQAEVLAGKFGMRTESELEDYERIVTLLVPAKYSQLWPPSLTPCASRPGPWTCMILPLFPWLKTSGLSLRT